MELNASILTEYSANLVEAIVAVIFVLRFNKGTLRKSPWTFPFAFALFTISNIFTHFTDFSIIQPFVFLAVLIGYAFTIKNTTVLRRIIAPVLFLIVTILCDTLNVFVLNSILNVPVQEIVSGSFLGRYLHIISSKIITISILMIINRVFSIEKKFQWFDLFTYLVFPIVTVANLYLFIKIGYSYDLSAYAALILFVIVALFVLNFLSMYLFKKAVQSTSMKYELEILNSRSQIEQSKYEELVDLNNQLQITRHDIKDHLIYIDHLLAEKNYEGVKQYIEKQQMDLEATKQVVITNNRMIDFLINYKLSKHKDIAFIVSGQLENLELIDELDLATLFGNVLDNAIEGVQGTSPMQIEISFSTNGNYQNIICKNSIPSSVLKNNPDLDSSKKNKKMHGYGIKSIRNVVEKYDGLIEFYEENDHFGVQIALPLHRI